VKHAMGRVGAVKRAKCSRRHASGAAGNSVPIENRRSRHADHHRAGAVRTEVCSRRMPSSAADNSVLIEKRRSRHADRLRAGAVRTEVCSRRMPSNVRVCSPPSGQRSKQTADPSAGSAALRGKCSRRLHRHAPPNGFGLAHRPTRPAKQQFRVFAAKRENCFPQSGPSAFVEHSSWTPSKPGGNVDNGHVSRCLLRGARIRTRRTTPNWSTPCTA